MAADSVLEIIAYGAWNGGDLVDNSLYEKKGLTFKGGIPVNYRTIEERIGVRTRIVAAKGERIEVSALQDLLATSDINPARIKVIIGATNIGVDKDDSGPLIRHPYELIRNDCPKALVLDLYAGCPGFNIAVELIFMLSLSGILKPADLSVVVGAENIHRANAFKANDTAHIIFGDDALASLLETKESGLHVASDCLTTKVKFNAGQDFAPNIAKKLLELNGHNKIDGIIVDNQLGKLEYRVPASAVRVQHHFVELMYPKEAAKGTFKRFREALEFYDQHVNAFAFDIMTLEQLPHQVQKIANAYVQSGKYKRIASIYLAADHKVELMLHEGKGRSYQRPQYGIIDTLTRSHGCFANYIEARPGKEGVFGKMNGKGVFLHATRGAKTHLTQLLSRNNLTIDDIQLLIEHQANFAMIPLTLEQILEDGRPDSSKAVADFIANKMVTNIHTRGNCSVVCMLRLPYDLQRGTLSADSIQGFSINRNLEELRHAKIILTDSVGAGMTRSSFLQIRK